MHKYLYVLLFKLFWINFLSFVFSAKHWEGRCGERPLQLTRIGRIVGGRDAYFGEVPWQVLVKESKFFGLWKQNKCGGVLIHRKWVLTAAHCNAGIFSSLIVILGEYNLTTWDDSGVGKDRTIIRKANKIIIHPDYNPKTLENDLALIQLDSSVEYERQIQPICLPEKDIHFEHEEGLVSGWGVTSLEKRKIPEVLQIVRVPILSNTECELMFDAAERHVTIKRTMLCAGFAIGGKDSCEGDSGGPLMVSNGPDGHWTLAGIVSNGIKCAEPNLPGIYTRVSEFKSWIIEMINEYSE